MLHALPRRIPTIFLFVSCLFAAAPAAVHAIVIAPIPTVDAVIAGLDVAVEQHGNSRIDCERSRLLLLADGTSLPLSLPADTAPDMLTSTIPLIYRET